MSSTIVTRYAKALLALTKQKGTHNEALTQLVALNQALHSDPLIQTYIENPVVQPEQKVQVLKKALDQQKFLEDVESTILLMAVRGRLGLFAEFLNAFQLGLDQENGVTRGTIRAAKTLSAEAQRDLEKKITEVLKKKIVLTFKEDPTLLGGVIAQVGGWTFDDSIESHLKRMNEALNRSAY